MRHALGMVVLSGSLLGAARGDDCRTRGTQGPVLASRPPCDVALPPGDLRARQRVYDHFAWQTFVALNWPVDVEGAPLASRRIGSGGDHRTVWETWMRDEEVFQVGASGPAPAWIPETHRARNLPELSTFIQPQFGPLVDQNGAYVRYEICMNQVMHRHIAALELHTREGQNRQQRIAFPCGSNTTGESGATMVKAAWKRLGGTDRRDRFHALKAQVLVSENPPRYEECWVGLIGFHLAVRTETAPQWVWATFEHVDNAPEWRHGEVQVDPAVNYLFFDPAAYDPDRSGGPESLNRLPAYPWDPGRTRQIPTQVVRLNPVALRGASASGAGFTDPHLEELNRAYQQFLRAVDPRSVWQHYMLIGCQHPTASPQVGCVDDPKDPAGRPAPRFLANSVIETFNQARQADLEISRRIHDTGERRVIRHITGPGHRETDYVTGTVPQGSSSCIDCHLRATAGDRGIHSDFTFMLRKVYPDAE